VEITVAIPGHSTQTINGRDDLLSAVAGARSAVHGFNVEFFDILVTVAPDQNSAVANLTAKGNVPAEKDFYVQELKFLLKKVEGQWLIFRVETVKTLSMNRNVRQASRPSLTASPALPGADRFMVFRALI
jgi:hypothetical protein